MQHPVIDLGSNLEENLERWSGALARPGAKLAVFKVIYSGKRQQWTAGEISTALRGRVSAKRVTECGKRLVGDGLIRQVSGAWPVVYEKISDVHHYKRRILRLAGNRGKRDSLPTKRKRQVNVRIGSVAHRVARAVEVTVDDIDQFARVRRLGAVVAPRAPLSERRFKAGLRKLFRESGSFPDWGGEKDDFFTNKLKIGGKRYTAAFALKGPGVGVKSITPGKWGKQGNQIQRLVAAPASVFFLQSEAQIHEDSVEQLKKLAEHKASQSGQKLFCGYIDRDDSNRLRRAYPECFSTRKV